MYDNKIAKRSCIFIEKLYNEKNLLNVHKHLLKYCIMKKITLLNV